LLAALRRKRYQCPNWRDDFRKLFKEAKWPKFNFDVRKSTILALARGYGDLERVNELFTMQNIQWKDTEAGDIDEATAVGLTATSKPPSGTPLDTDDGDDSDEDNSPEEDVNALMSKLDILEAENAQLRRSRKTAKTEHDAGMQALQDTSIVRQWQNTRIMCTHW
jgi:hypothetical protein